MGEVVHFDIAELLSSPELGPARDSAGNSWTEYTGYEPRPGDKVLHVPSSISPEELWNRFISKRRPVIIDGFPTDPEWQAHKWTDLDRLRELAGDSHVKVEPIHPSFGHFGTGTARTHTTFGQFLDVLQDPEEAGRWYLTTQYDSDSDAEDEEESDGSSDAEQDDFDAIDQQLQNLESAIETEALASVILAEGDSRKRKRSESSEPESASATDQQSTSNSEGVGASSMDDDEMGDLQDGDEDENDEEDDASVQLSDSEEEPDLDDILPSPTHALVTDFPAQPKLTGGLVLQQCNLWLGSSASSTSDPSSRSPSASGSPSSPMPGKSSGLHHDFHDNLYALLSGRKRLLLFPPSAHQFLHPRGPILRVHKNGLIVYGPRDHEIDHGVAQDLLNSASLFGPDGPDLETLEYLRDRHYSMGRQRSLALRSDGLTPLDAAKWRIRARARALAEANERAAAAAGEHRIRRDRRKGKARQTREQEEALQRYQLAKKEFLLQRLIDEDDDNDDNDSDEDIYGYSADETRDQLTAAQVDAILHGQDDSDEIDSDIAGLMEDDDDEDDDDEVSLDVSSPGFFDLEQGDRIVSIDLEDVDDEDASSESTQDSLDLMEDLFEQQKAAILALRAQAETSEDEELQTRRLQILVRRRQEILEAREAKARAQAAEQPPQREGKKQRGNSVKHRMESKSGRANGREPDSEVEFTAGSDDGDDDDGNTSEAEGWMMFDDLEKERRMQEDAAEEEDESESDDVEEESTEEDEDDEDSERNSEDTDLTALQRKNRNDGARQIRSDQKVKVKNVASKRQHLVTSAPINTKDANGLVQYSDENDERHDTTSPSNLGDGNCTTGSVEGETELDRALRLNGIDDSRLLNGSEPQSAEDDDESEDESSGDFFGSDEGDDGDEDELDIAMIEDGEALLQALERKAQKLAKNGTDPAGKPEEEDEDDEDEEESDQDDDCDLGETGDERPRSAEDTDEQKEPSSFSRIKPHILHAFYGLDSSPACDVDNEHANNHKAGSKTKPFDPRSELTPRPGCPQPLVVDLEPGQCLYLPASWWHEVTSMSTAEHPFHCALNFWFHPPNNLAPKQKNVGKKKNKKGKVSNGTARQKQAGLEVLEHEDGQPNGSSAAAAAAGSHAAEEEEEAVDTPSAANPYEDAEVWDEIRRTVAKLVRDARHRAELAQLERVEDISEDEAPTQDLVAPSARKAVTKRRRKG